MKKLGIIIVNRNHLNYIRNIVVDLANQDSKDFDVVIVDNGSDEKNTKSALESLYEKHDFIRAINYTNKNEPLNHLWNAFLDFAYYDYYCFMNNDMRLAHNFVSSTIQAFEKEPNVGCVAHTTNHPKFSMVSNELEYVIFKDKYRQGWDFTMRRDAYTTIPSQLHFFCGDDFLFENLYKKGFRFAMVLNSPIIHYQGMTPRVKGISNRDITNYKKLGYPHPRLDICFAYSQFKPTFEKFTYKP